MQPAELVAGRFELQSEVAAGGMGKIFKAHDNLTGAVVAIKVMARLHLAERFLRESALLAEINHPAIVRYVAHGKTLAGEPYLAMEWLDGEDLEQHLVRCRFNGKTHAHADDALIETQIGQEAPQTALSASGSGATARGLSVSDVVTLARRLASALSELHSRQIIHRDLKPANLFLPDFRVDRLKLLDFGTARIHGAAHDMTRTGVLIGTPLYMAPEQVMASRQLSAATDIWAAGCVLYEALTLAPPFEDVELVRVLAKILHDAPPPLAALRPDLPSALSALIQRMLAKDDRQRPADGQEFLQKLSEMRWEAAAEPSPLVSPAAPPRRLNLSAKGLRMQSALLLAPLTPAPPDEAVARELERRGAQLQSWGGPPAQWLVTLRRHHPPAEEAVRLARLGLALRPRLLGLALVCGKVVEGESAALDSLAADAAALLREAAQQELRVDALSAVLLEARFEITPAASGSGLCLRGEREVEGPRTLLGKSTQMVGRQRELGLLQQLWEDCIEDQLCKAVLVSATTGSGKSRLRAEFVRGLLSRGEEVNVWIGQGDELSAGSPFGVLGSAIRRALGLLEGETLAQHREQLRQRLREVVPAAELMRVAAFLGELLRIPFPDDASPALAAARRDSMLMADGITAAWLRWLTLESQRRPVLLLLEDLQWGDLPSIKLVDAALAQSQPGAVLVLALARPEVHSAFPQLWAQRALLELRLEPLNRRASEQLIRQALGAEVPAALVQQLVARSLGNPFCLEELIRAVANGAQEQLPDTVLGMLQVRLDALGPEAKRVLEVASVFGEVFWEAGVASLLGPQPSGVSLGDWLEHLVVREMIVRQPTAQPLRGTAYKYRHALLREATYALLSEEDRTLGHRLAGEWLAAVGERDELALAEHFIRGRAPGQAVAHYQRAAAAALEGNDLAGAHLHAEKGKSAGASGEALGQLLALQAMAASWQSAYAETLRHAEEALRWLSPGSAVWFQVVGYASSANSRSVGTAMSQRWSQMALSAPAQAESQVEQIICLSRCCAHLVSTGQNADTTALWAKLAETVGDHFIENPLARAQYAHACFVREVMAGEHGRAAVHQEQVVAAFEQAGDLRNCLVERAGLVARFCELGLLEEAEALGRQNLALCEQHKIEQAHAYTQLTLGSVLVRIARQLDEARQRLEDAFQFYTRSGHVRWRARAQYWLAEAALAAGEPAAAVRHAEFAVELLQQLPAHQVAAMVVSARAHLAAGALTEGLQRARAAMALLEQAGGTIAFETSVPLVLAEALRWTGAEAEAQPWFAEAQVRLLRRAERIPRPQWREKFLALPEHVRILSFDPGASQAIRNPSAIPNSE